MHLVVILLYCGHHTLSVSHVVLFKGVRTRTQIYDMVYLLTAIGLTPGGSSTVLIYTQTIHRITQIIHRTNQLTKNNTIN